MLAFESIDVLYVTGGDLVVTWLFKPTTDDISAAVVTLSRSYDTSEEAEQVTVGSASGDTLFIRDPGVDRQDKSRKPLYKLKATLGDRTIESFNNTVRTVSDAPARAMVRRIGVDMRLGGVPVFLFKRRRAGERCPDCWSASLGRMLVGDCSTCAGTGFLEGYFKPFLTVMKIDVPDENSALTAVGTDQERQVTGKALPWPIISPADIIHEVERALWWRVDSPIRPDEFRRVVLQQNLLLADVNPADPEYDHIRLPLEPGQPLVLPRTNREFFYMAEGDDGSLTRVTVSPKDDKQPQVF